MLVICAVSHIEGLLCTLNGLDGYVESDFDLRARTLELIASTQGCPALFEELCDELTDAINNG